MQAVLWIFIYVVTNLYMTLMGPVDMKKKYKAEWALVTGAGTGERILTDMAVFVIASQGSILQYHYPITQELVNP